MLAELRIRLGQNFFAPAGDSIYFHTMSIRHDKTM
jgi:hypothetical protein